MANLNKPKFLTSLRTLLRFRKDQDEALLEAIIEMSVRDLIDEFDSSINSRTIRNLKVVNEFEDDVKEVSRIYLPEDFSQLREITINDCNIVPVDSVDLDDVDNVVTASLNISDSGCRYLQFPRLLADSDYDIKCIYRIHTSDISLIPEEYKNLLIYTCNMHNKLLNEVDVQIISKAESMYVDLRNKLRSKLGNRVTHQKRPHETKWEGYYVYPRS